MQRIHHRGCTQRSRGHFHSPSHLASPLRRPIIHSLCTSSIESLMTSIDHWRHCYLTQTIILSSINELNSTPADYSGRVFLLLFLPKRLCLRLRLLVCLTKKLWMRFHEICRQVRSWDREQRIGFCRCNLHPRMHCSLLVTLTQCCHLANETDVALCFFIYFIVGSRPSDHYFRSVCWFVCLSVCLFVCAEFFSAVFDPISIKLGHKCYMSGSSCVP